MNIPVTTDTGSTPQQRRYDHDVTNLVNVSSVTDVREAVIELYSELWPRACLDEVWLAFHDFERLFMGRIPNYLGCDTVYHDIQHSLDVTLAAARLIVGYERTVNENDRLGADRAVLGIIIAIFHDAGYIRNTNDQRYKNGAEITRWHVSRSANWLKHYLPGIGLYNQARLAAEIVHFTGYEKKLDEIELDDPRDSMLGHLIGTADLIAQMADRCYLEKCRDRLYLEFVLGGVAIENDGTKQVIKYQSGIDLLLQTPDFYRHVVKKRLVVDFNKAYRYVEALFNGRNPYLEFIERNIAHLEHIIETGDWLELRRLPPCFTVNENPVTKTNALVNQHIIRLRNQATHSAIAKA
ncbi:MAG: hypothetical protein ACR2QG_03685 [Gammaproteobacteria bacterium]